jgi:hypothetical protein
MSKGRSSRRRFLKAGVATAAGAVLPAWNLTGRAPAIITRACPDSSRQPRPECRVRSTAPVRTRTGRLRTTSQRARWCELRHDFRNFRLDRARELVTLDPRFLDEPGKALRDFLTGYGPEAVKLLDP